MEKTRFLIIRHGESEANRKLCFAGHAPFHLTERGFEQAILCGDWIRENETVDMAFTSDLVRAVETAETVCSRLEKLPLIREPGFREIDAGKWEGMAFDEVARSWKEDYRIWRENVAYSRCTGGESFAEMRHRVLAALGKLAKEYPGKTLLVSTHACPLRAIQAQTVCKGSEGMAEVGWVPNASVSVVEVDGDMPETVLPVRFGISSYLGALKTVLPKGV